MSGRRVDEKGEDTKFKRQEEEKETTKEDEGE